MNPDRSIPEAVNNYEQELRTNILGFKKQIVLHNLQSVSLPLNEENLGKLPVVFIARNEIEALSLSPIGEWLYDSGICFQFKRIPIRDGVLATFAFITDPAAQEITTEQQMIAYLEKNRISLLEGLKQTLEEIYHTMTVQEIFE